MSKPPQPPPKKQVDRFIETARALECDEDKERFEAKMKRIAKVRSAKPLPSKGKKL
jgi:hypothetical protein